MIFLESNTLKLMNLLVNATYHLNIEDIVKALKTNKRNAYYEIDKLNNQLENLTLKNCLCDNLGNYYLNDNQKKVVKNILDNKEYELILNKDERTSFIILQLFIKPKITVNDIAEKLNISRSTTLKELKKINSQYNFSFNNANGYVYNGNLQEALILFFNTCAKLSDYLLNVDKHILSKLNKLQDDLDIYFVNNQQEALSLLIEYVNCFVPYLDKCNDRAYFLNDYFDLNDNENKVISKGLTLIRSSLLQNSEYNCIEIAKRLIINFEQVSLITFNHEDNLVERLANHLKSAIYRYENNIKIENALLEDIKNNYQEIFDFVEIAFKRLNLFNISDDELAFLTMHFLSVIKPIDINDDLPKILVVCNAGLANSNILKNELHDLLGQDAIIKVSKNIIDDNNYDLIISTIPLTIDNYLLVKPILSEYDKMNILNSLGCKQQLNIQQVINIASKYMNKKNYKLFKQEIYKLENNKLSIDDFKHQFKKYSGKYSYKEAIKEVSNPLVCNHSIDINYINEIIKLIEELGDYMFVDEHIILAHASLTYCNDLDLSIGFFDEPVIFNQKQAKIIIVLSCKDQNSHLPLIKQLRLMIKNKDFNKYL